MAADIASGKGIRHSGWVSNGRLGTINSIGGSARKEAWGGGVGEEAWGRGRGEGGVGVGKGAWGRRRGRG